MGTLKYNLRYSDVQTLRGNSLFSVKLSTLPNRKREFFSNVRTISLGCYFTSGDQICQKSRDSYATWRVVSK